MRRRARSGLCLLACVCGLALPLATPASAAVTFHYATDQTLYQVAPGDSVVVTLKLVERRDSAADSSVLEDESGLIGFDARVHLQFGSARITDISADTSAFTSLLAVMYQPVKPLSSSGVTTADFAVSALDLLGPVGAEIGLTRELVLGTVTITASLAAGDEVSRFQVADSGLGSNAITNLGTPLDSLIAPVDFDVQVPEPTGVAVAVLGLLAVCRRPARQQ